MIKPGCMIVPLRLLAIVPAFMSVFAAGLPLQPPQRVLVKFKQGPRTTTAGLDLPAEVRLLDPPRPVAPAGGRRRLDFKPTVFQILELPEGVSVDEVVAGLAKNPAVEYAEPDGIGSGGEVIPNDPDAAAQWHHNIVRSRVAWEITKGSPDVILAVLDTGLNVSLPDYVGRVLPGYDFVNNDSDPADDQGHGSAVTAVAAGTGNNGQDTAGIDWNCRIMPLKVLDSSNNGFYSVWAAAIDYAVANGADVINLSAGGPTSDTTLTNAIDNAISHGVIFVTITHNDGSNTIRFPGRLSQCITVGATRNNNVVSSFSNYGPEIDLVAPGGVGASGNFSSNVVTTSLNGDKVWYYGTSFSAPQVAGTATLIRALRPSINQAEMEAILCASALDQVGDARDTAGFDNYYGYGRLDIPNALILATADHPQLAYLSPGLVSLAWPSPANANSKKPFGIQYSSDLEHWSGVDRSATLDVSGGRAVWTDDGSLTGTPPGAARYYRSFIRR